MNHVCRVSRREFAPGPTPEERTALNASMRMFAPIIMRVDTLLSRLPPTRRVLFRGVRNVPVANEEYIPGRLVAWHQPSSASEDWDVARRFGGTIFTIHAHSTAVIDFLSCSPTEKEAMLPSYTVLCAMGATSPTLLRMLEVNCNQVTLRELGDTPSIDHIIAASIGGHRLMAEWLFKPFTRKYVEATLGRERPPLAPWKETKKLLTVLNDVVEVEVPAPLLLLGDGGTGKTSAMLAAYCHLAQQQPDAVPKVLPVFIPLPQLSDLHDDNALDRRVWDQIGVTTRSDAEQVARRATIVLLLDSLDECNILPEHEESALVESNSFCAKHCRIIISCRSESAHLATTAGIVCGQNTSTWHLQPFSQADVHACFDKYAASLGGSMSATSAVLIAAIDAYDPYGELRELPIALSMMLQLAAADAPAQIAASEHQLQQAEGERPLERYGKKRQEPSCHTIDHAASIMRNVDANRQLQFEATPNAVSLEEPLRSDVIESPRATVYRKYLTMVCQDAAKKSVLSSTTTTTTPHGVPASSGDYIPSTLDMLRLVALLMLERGHWQLPLHNVVDTLETYWDAACAQRFKDMLQTGSLPCRVDSVEPSANFGFSHKTIGEYLAATALWTQPQLLPRIRVCFSCLELGVMRWFGDISSGDATARALVCGGAIIDLLRRTNDEAVASNAMALIACSGYPLDGFKIEARRIVRCNLRHANLSQCDLTGVTFEHCELHDADLTESTVEGTVFRRCEFGLLRQLHTEGFVHCASADGRYVVSASHDGTVNEWEFATGRKVNTLEGDGSPVTKVCTMPGHRQYVFLGSSDNCVRIWNAAGSDVRKLQGHTAPVCAMCVTPDGRHVFSGSWDTSVCMWNVARECQVRKFEGHTDAVTTLALTPDTHHIVSGSMDNSVRVWDVATGREERKLKGRTDSTCVVVVTPDGLHVVSGSHDGTIRMWDVATGHETLKFEGNKNPASLSSDSHVMSGSHDGTVMRKWEGHASRVSALCMMPDGRHVMSGSQDTVRIWDVATGRVVRKLEGHMTPVSLLSVTLDGHIVSGSRDGTVNGWDVATSRDVRKSESHAAPVSALCLLPRGLHVVSGSHDGTIRMWDVATGREVLKLEGHTAPVSALCLLPNGQVVSASRDGTVRIWDVATGRQVRKLQPDGNMVPVRTLCAMPDGHIVTGMWDGTLRVLDATVESEAKTLEGHTAPVSALCLLPNGQVVSASRDGTVRIWDVATGRQVRKLQPDGNMVPVRTLCAMPDGHIVTGMWDGTLRVLDATVESEAKKLEGHTAPVSALCLLTNGHVVSASRDGTVRIWDVATGREVHTVAHHTASFSSMCVTPDNHHILAGCWDKSVRIWRVDEPTLERRRLSARCVALDCHGTTSRSFDGTVPPPWISAPGREVRKLELRRTSAMVSTLSVTPDVRQVVLRSLDGRVWTWDVATGRLQCKPGQHTYAAHTIDRGCATIHDDAVCREPRFIGDVMVIASGTEIVVSFKTAAASRMLGIFGCLRLGNTTGTIGAGSDELLKALFLAPNPPSPLSHHFPGRRRGMPMLDGIREHEEHPPPGGPWSQPPPRWPWHKPGGPWSHHPGGPWSHPRRGPWHTPGGPWSHPPPGGPWSHPPPGGP